MSKLANGMIGWAEFDSTGVYRYLLGRSWSLIGPMGAFILLNPSTATGEENDPTITRCCGFGERWGWRGLYVLNAFAFRATDPKVMKAVEDPVGPGNDAMIVRVAREVAESGGLLVAGWGAHGVHQKRDVGIRELLRQVANVYCLGVTGACQPRHPLYLKANLDPEIYFRRSEAA